MWQSGAFFVHFGEMSEGSGSVWLSALVLVDVQLFDLLLQEGNGHGAATGPVWQRVHLEHREHTQGVLKSEVGGHFWHVLDLVCPSKVSLFSQGTRGHDSCGGFLSSPFFQASTLQGLSGWRGQTARNQPCCFSARSFPCCFPSRYFGGRQTSRPLNLKDGQKKEKKRNQSSGLFLNQWIRLCLTKNGRTEAATLGPGFRCRGSWTGPGCVFLFLQAFCSHLISTVPVTVYPTVWETDTDGTCEPAVRMIVDYSFPEYSLTLTVVALFDHSPQLETQIWSMWFGFMPMMIEFVF